MGNTHTRGRKPGLSGDAFNRDSRSASPGSPLTYGPQLAMEPIARAQQDASISNSEMPTLPDWGPAQPKLVPTAIVWSHGGASVQVEGSFDNWTKRLTLEKSNKDFTIIKLLPPGVYQFKFIVDGEWRYDPNQPAMYDEIGNVNNVIEVQEYLPENLDGLTGFEPPPSPDASYDNAQPAPEEFNKEPPVMPAHLNLTLLNVPPAMDAQAVLPRPQHVILNHSYVQRSSEGMDAIAVGTTQRYGSKYITTVLYKPQQWSEKAASDPQPISLGTPAGF